LAITFPYPGAPKKVKMGRKMKKEVIREAGELLLNLGLMGQLMDYFPRFAPPSQ